MNSPSMDDVQELIDQQVGTIDDAVVECAEEGRLITFAGPNAIATVTKSQYLHLEDEYYYFVRWKSWLLNLWQLIGHRLTTVLVVAVA